MLLSLLVRPLMRLPARLMLLPVRLMLQLVLRLMRLPVPLLPQSRRPPSRKAERHCMRTVALLGYGPR